MSKYIAADKLSAMSDLERRCCANQIRNYQMLKEIGMSPCCLSKFDNFVEKLVIFRLSTFVDIVR